MLSTTCISPQVSIRGKQIDVDLEVYHSWVNAEFLKNVVMNVCLFVHIA